MWWWWSSWSPSLVEKYPDNSDNFFITAEFEESSVTFKKKIHTKSLSKNPHHPQKMSLKNPLGTSFISSLVIGFIWMVKWMVPNGFLFLFFLINSSLLASCKAKVNSSFLQKQKCALRKWYFLLHLSSQENYQQNATILKSFYFCILKDLRFKFKTPTK